MNKKIVFGIFLTVILLFAGFVLKSQYDKKKILEEEIRIKNIISEIKEHYGQYVVTVEETKLYKKENNKFVEFGKINKDILVTLKEETIDENTKYFLIDDINLYIQYSKVTPVQEKNIEDRFKNYIYFNENIKTKNITSFYDSNNNLVYTINQSFDFKILVKDDDRYGVVYNDQLLYIKSDNVQSVYNNNNTNLKNKSRIRTLTYHFIYNQATESCNESICHSFEQFESHLKYIKENNYFSLKLNELEMYLDGKIQIPEKSIVLTIDDGTIFNVGAIDLLEKYDVNATLFAITKYVTKESFQSNNLDLESHTDNMHNQYECPGYGNQGGGILCLPEEKVLKDLKTSQEKLGGSKYFAYPFFDFSDRAISLLKQAGFKLAFIGQYTTDGYSYPKSTDKYKVPRKTIFSDTSFQTFISYLK